MTTWKARPTTYRGIQMRSRLEARYAAFLDAQGEEWEYEPNAFGGRAGQYLPDFVLPMTAKDRWYVEVKPTVELGMAAMPKMLVVLESEPGAWLQVVVPDAGDWINKPYDRRWTWYPGGIGA